MKSTKLNRFLKIALVLILLLAGTLLYLWTTVESTACTSAATPAHLASWLDRCYLLEVVRRLAELVIGVVTVAFITDNLLRRVYLEEIRSVVEELLSTSRSACGVWIYAFRCANLTEPIWGVFEVSSETGRLRAAGEAFYGGQPADSAHRRGLWVGKRVDEVGGQFAIDYQMLIQNLPAGATRTYYEGRFDFMSRRASLNPALSNDIYVGDVESRLTDLIVGKGTAMAVRLRTPEMLPAPTDPNYYPTLQELVLKCLGVEVRPTDQRPPKSRRTGETKAAEPKAA